jgi:hypothetical protein
MGLARIFHQGRGSASLGRGHDGLHRKSSLVAAAQAGVRDVGRVPSMYVGPDDALVTMDLNLQDGTTAAAATKPSPRSSTRCASATR